MAHPPLEALLAALLPPTRSDDGPPQRLFAMLDGARDERIYRRVYESALPYECLFAGQLSYDLAVAAPYLVELAPASPFTRWLLEEGWGKSFGVFAWSRADLETLRRHCRRLLQVKDERGRRLFFRYYDPRVLRTYLPTCNAGELRDVLGPFGRLLAEDAEGDVRWYEAGGRPLRMGSVPFT